MSKKSKKAGSEASDAEGTRELSRKDEAEGVREGRCGVLQGELVAMQEWVKATGPRSASCSRAWTRRARAARSGGSPSGRARGCSSTSRCPRPTEREKSQMYVQRYIAHFPAAGEVAIFDRSWYNRAGVEPVMGYCTPEQTEKFLEQVPAVEKAMVDNGIILIKYWLNVSVEEQTRRLESRIEDPRKIWKLSPTDLKSYSRHYDYCRARDAMFAATDTGVGAVVRRGQRRQEARPAQHHLPPAEPDPVRAAPAAGREDARKPSRPRVRRSRTCLAAPHPDALLRRG